MLRKVVSFLLSRDKENKSFIVCVFVCVFVCVCGWVCVCVCVCVRSCDVVGLIIKLWPSQWDTQTEVIALKSRMTGKTGKIC